LLRGQQAGAGDREKNQGGEALEAHARL
jgi:hypothetical protein